MRRVSLTCASLSLFALLAALAGCGRHVVLEPKTFERLNDRAWTITSQRGSRRPHGRTGASAPIPTSRIPAPAIRLARRIPAVLFYRFQPNGALKAQIPDFIEVAKLG